MKNVLSIFIRDLKSLTKQFLAMAVVIAITVIPALYAWLNIYANMDPYGNTKNIKIACASDDVGYSDLDGKHVNMGETVLKQLQQKDSINFVVYDDSNAAIEAAESGKCYGAIVFHKNFTQNMYDLASALGTNEATITFYENYKLNAVANKITETAASTVNQTIQEQYLEVLFNTALSKIESITDVVDAQSTGNRVLDIMYCIRSMLVSLSDALDVFSTSSLDFADKMGGISTESTSELLDKTASNVEKVNTGLHNTRNAYKIEIVPEVNKLIDELISAMEALPNTDSMIKSEAFADISDKASTLQKDGAMLQAISPAYGEQVLEVAENIKTMTDSALSGVISPDEQLINTMKKDLTNLKNINIDIDKTIDAYFDMLLDLSDNLSPIINSLSNTIGSINPTIQSASNTLYALDDTLVYLRMAVKELIKTMDNLIAKAEDVSANELSDTITEMLEGNSSSFAEFFSCPVTVRTEVLYPVSNYGTAMTPFYTTLAIWVGCVVLAAILKIEAEPGKLKSVKDSEIFFARFLLFLILNEIQTAIIVAGDLYLLKISCTNPGGFFFASAMTSFSFTCLIYSLVLAFRDIGKAIVVVIMVLQIAGSGGTYPIEILDDVFSKLYLLFPFPYSIEAMRETICGFYENDFWIYLLKLMLFAAAGLLIGLFVRKPFIEINEYVEEEMEETGVL